MGQTYGYHHPQIFGGGMDVDDKYRMLMSAALSGNKGKFQHRRGYFDLFSLANCSHRKKSTEKLKSYRSGGAT